MRATLRQLPRELAMVVYLADVEDFSPAEIADVLGISPSTAASRLHHGRQRLLRLLTDAARRRGLLD
ncbi:sigma factor-like helix-turn-helix DNA-binding protein [Streptomyces pratisoli]|uniref:sigma factor-like helix-turn-helix DNA-binding protein n=1 Tax=Streptomyces TaxID=1883 RepID=UPI003C12BC99